MSEQVSAPIVGGKVDPDDPSGSVVSVIVAILGLILFGVIVSAAAFLWNQAATRTPDTVPEVTFA